MLEHLKCSPRPEAGRAGVRPGPRRALRGALPSRSEPKAAQTPLSRSPAGAGAWQEQAVRARGVEMALFA